MVELLAAVTILAVVSLIAIKGVSGLIDRAKEERVVQQQKTLTIAAESYLQANTQYRPKTIGESRYINVSTLKKANYLKDDITNSKGESCMTNSVVRVYKLSKMEYSYYPYIYCGSEVRPATLSAPKPSAKTYFTDASGKPIPSKLSSSNIAKARLNIAVYGYDYTISNPDKDIAIDSYSYSIIEDNNDGRRTIYDSGSLSANRKTEVNISFSLKDYVDLSTANTFYVNVFVRNIHGGEVTLANAIDSNGVGMYSDNIPPNCIEIQNQAAPDEWINKYSAVSESTITVTCDDGDGSGCVRDTFSRTWPNKSQKSAEYAYVRTKDNAGNSMPSMSDYLTSTCEKSGELCCVRVNVDTVAPTINLKAFKYTGSGTSVTGQNILKKSKMVANDSSENQIVEVNTEDISGNVDGWLNAVNFDHGIAFKVSLSDDIGIESWKWEVNATNIENVEDDKYGVVAVNKTTEGDSKQFTGRKKNVSEFVILLKEEGMRKGVLTVRDIAGNETKYVIYMNIGTKGPNDCDDGKPCITAPKSTLNLYKYREKDNPNKGEVYVPKTWSNLSVIAAPSDEVIDYVLSHHGSYFKYLVYLENSGTAGSASTATEVGPFYARNDNYVFDNSSSPISNGKNRIALIVCSQSKNCIQSNNYDVWIDTVAPECNLTETRSDTGKVYDGSYWLGIGKNAIVTAKCSDPKGNYTASGCENSSEWPSTFSFTYDFDVSSSKAGAKGIDTNGDNHGAVKDKAGNVTECLANKTVKVDHTAPTCSVSAKLNNSSDYDGTWKKNGNYVTVNGSCSDAGGSGSGSGCMIYSGNQGTFDSTKTTASKKYASSIDTKKATPFGNNVTTYVVDGAGNKVECSPKTVRIDTTDPVCGSATNSAASGVWRNNSSITITQTCASDSWSGCNNSLNYSKTYTSDMSSDSIRIYDNAGNYKDCSVNVNRDTVPPSCGDKDQPEPTSYAPSRTRTVGCISGSGSGVSPCSQSQFSRTWTYASDGKVDSDYITISDKAGNTRSCPVNVLVYEEPETIPTPDDPDTPTTNICSLNSKSESTLFGTAISGSPNSLSGTKTFKYKHIDRNLGKTLELTVQDNKVYNYFPMRNSGDGNFANFAYGFNAAWSTSGNWCHANGTSCGSDGKGRWCYARVCSNESACGSYLGWTAEAMTQAAKDAGCSHSYARCWCSCSSSNLGRDWFN